MPRIASIVLLLAVVAPAAPVPDAGAARRKSDCQRLKANHRDLSPHRTLVLVARGGFETGDISACVLPRGRVRRLVRWDDGLGRASAGLVATKGYFVLISEGWGDQYGGVSEELFRVDARTKRRAPLAGFGCWTDFGAYPCSDGTRYGATALAATGAGAVELTDLASGATSLHAFDRAGTLARIGDGPVEDLRIESGEIVWTYAGTEQRAPLPG